MAREAAPKSRDFHSAQSLSFMQRWPFAPALLLLRIAASGVYIGHHESGYAPFRFYIHNATNATLNYGAENVLAVHVDALSHQEGWFYEGGGIYR
jgi:hypothetical protein